LEATSRIPGLWARSVGTDLLNRYTAQVILAGQRDDAVVVRFNEVISLVRALESLLSPPFMLRLLAAARRANQPRLREEGTSHRIRSSTGTS
jgi:hypothetical protein